MKEEYNIGYLTKAFNEYYYSNDDKQKEKIKMHFKKIVWGSVPYTKIHKANTYMVSYNNISNDTDLELLIKYKHIEYKILRSRYNLNTVDKIDLVKANINSTYGVYFDKEIYLNKKYYYYLNNYKNIYFNYLEGNIKDLKKEIRENNENVKFWKEKSIEYKYDLKWCEYKKYVNKCFDKIFINFIPLEEKMKNGETLKNDTMDWDEDNYVLVYIKKSLKGYIKNWIKKYNKPKHNYCQICGIEIFSKFNNKKYCENCAYERKKESKNNYKKRKRKSLFT